MTVRYFPIPLEIFNKIKSLKLGYSTESFFISLCQLANNLSDSNGWFYRSIGDLQKDTNMERKTLFQAIKNLEGEFIEVDRRTSPNHYKINTFTFKSFKRAIPKNIPVSYRKTAHKVV